MVFYRNMTKESNHFQSLILQRLSPLHNGNSVMSFVFFLLSGVQIVVCRVILTVLCNVILAVLCHVILAVLCHMRMMRLAVLCYVILAGCQALSQKKRVGCPNPKASGIEVVTARRRDAMCERHNVL